jgi:hypothetical protein
LLNASRAAANDFRAEFGSRMNTRPARGYTEVAPAQSSGLAARLFLTRVSRRAWESLLHDGRTTSKFTFLPWCLVDTGLRFKWRNLKFSVLGEMDSTSFFFVALCVCVCVCVCV